MQNRGGGYKFAQLRLRNSWSTGFSNIETSRPQSSAAHTNVPPVFCPIQFTVMTTPPHAERLLAILARISFRLGQFKLSSGGTSDYYIDCRTTTLHAEGGRLTGEAILDLLQQNHIEAEAVGGLTLGADPIVSNLATASAWRAISHPGTPLIHGFLVRKAEKQHGKIGRAHV